MFDPNSIAMADKARFSLIYSVDCPKDDNLRWRVPEILPPQSQRAEKLWQVTEQGESEIGDDETDPWIHWKFCAILNWRQFRDFIEHCELCQFEGDTMGSIGAPGFGFGWAPALSVSGERQDAYQNAYITPWFDDIAYRCDWEPVAEYLEAYFSQGDPDAYDEHTLADISRVWVHVDQLQFAD